MIFFTVLKSGLYRRCGEYKPEHVYAIHSQLKKFYKKPFRFYCLSDMPLECQSNPLKHDYPGWWSKIELFKFPFKETDQAFYIDLDTVIVGDITNFVDSVFKHKDFNGFSALQEIPPPSRKGEDWPEPRVGSGLMAWRGDQRDIYNAFAKSPAQLMENYKRGDQQFITNLRHDFMPMNKRLDGIYSYKFSLDWKDKDVLPKDAKIICFHGTPKPWDVTHDWQKDFKN